MKVFLVTTVLLITTHLTNSQYNDLKKSSIYNNYVDDHCEGHYQVETNTIIRTEDSMAGGGVFLNETSARSLARCLHYCCSYPLCNTAVYDERSDDADGGSCYLFDCGSLDNIKCQFTSNNGFSSAMLDIDRHKFDLSSVEQREGHSKQLSDLRAGGEVEECGQFQFKCSTGECIASYDTCNGIPQCRDGSDEDTKLCPAPTPLPPHRHLRPDMDRPGYQQYPPPEYYYPRPIQYPQYPNMPPPLQYPHQGYPPIAQPQPQPPPVLNRTGTEDMPTTSTTKRTTVTTRKTTRKIRTTTTLSPEERYEAELIDQLGDELSEMETPGFAILTLTLGIILICLLCLLVACRIKQGKMGYRRGLAHDADGDFLVNGMYL